MLNKLKMLAAATMVAGLGLVTSAHAELSDILEAGLLTEIRDEDWGLLFNCQPVGNSCP